MITRSSAAFSAIPVRQIHDKLCVSAWLQVFSAFIVANNLRLIGWTRKSLGNREVSSENLRTRHNRLSHALKIKADLYACLPNMKRRGVALHLTLSINEHEGAI